MTKSEKYDMRPHKEKICKAYERTFKKRLNYDSFQTESEEEEEHSPEGIWTAFNPTLNDETSPWGNSDSEGDVFKKVPVTPKKHDKLLKMLD